MQIVAETAAGAWINPPESHLVAVDFQIQWVCRSLIQPKSWINDHSTVGKITEATFFYCKNII